MATAYQYPYGSQIAATTPNNAGTTKYPGIPVAGASSSSAPANTNQIYIPYQASNVYTPEMTAHAVNQAAAQYAPDARFSQKQFMGHGQSMSAGTLAGAMPEIGQQNANALAQQAQIPLADYSANQQNLLQGQALQGQYGNQIQALLNALTGLNNQYDLNVQNNQLGVTGSLIGAAG